MKTVAWVIAALVLLTGLGALVVNATQPEPPAPIVVPRVESGALQHRAAADAKAAAWDEDAVLVAVVAGEGPAVDRLVDPPFRWDTSADPFVGNGLALAWTFLYASEAQPERAFFVTYGGDASLLYARALDRPYYHAPVAVEHAASCSPEADCVASSPAVEHEPGIGEVVLDASDAMAAVAGREEFADFALDHPVFEAVFALHGWGDHAAWTITYRTATSYGASAAVDAKTGEVLHVGRWPMWCCPTPPVDPPVPPTPHPVEPCCRPEDFHQTYRGDVGGSGPMEIRFPVYSAAWLQRIDLKADAEEGVLGGLVMEVYDADWRIVGRATSEEGLAVTIDRTLRSGDFSVILYDAGVQVLPRSRDATIDVAVTYADAPRPLDGEYVFLGRAWPGYEQQMSLWAEGEVVPVEATLSFDARLPTDEMELVVYDQWGNEVDAASAGGGFGEHTVTLGLPADSECCWTLGVRRVSDTGYIYGGDELAYTLRLVYVPRVVEPYVVEGHAHHAH